ncbi:MAG TPA: alpha-glucuronidase family glycosyl hydrolase [Algoriphagus sp.]|nr:alpha-glucuronidase family glycosyl hydrolase [Algoriphagus sp.]
MKKSTSLKLILTCFLLTCFFEIKAQSQEMMDLSTASLYVSKQDSEELTHVIQVLQEEVEKRSGRSIQQSKKLDNAQTQIVLALDNGAKELPENLANPLNELENINEEGYRITVLPQEQKVIIQAKTKRGALYGVGKLLRKMKMGPDEVLIPKNLQIASSPKNKIRGHQLGYRPKTNSYDAWSVAQFDQYIRDLAIFGANSIEIMPPRTDDDFTSKHMQLPAIDMIREQSRICEKYDLDVWMWYPNLGLDYRHPDSLKREIEERREVFATVPRLDHLFVPGGDPGDLEPDLLFEWLDQVADILHEHHPNAKIWISPQVFRPTNEWFDIFFSHVNKKPEWLGGVVFGPWVKMPIDEIRKRLDQDLPIRRYPDITHSLSSQYPIPKWDLAWAITLGRECINPRPIDQKMIHNALDQYAVGSISYSEGTNDDLNKFIWSDQDWNPEISEIETLRDYSSYFIDSENAEELAQGFMALEQNLRGPLLTNSKVPLTLQQWQAIELNSNSEVKKNFRFQMGLIRAYFDAYVQKRLLNEKWLEQSALQKLGNYQELGVEMAISECKSTLAIAWEEPIDPSLLAKCLSLADELYESIGAQLTIEKHGAMSGRGNFIDNINNPLNDVAWIYYQLSLAEKAAKEEEKEAIIKGILDRTNPGPGGFYDNFGEPSSWEKVVFNYDVALDPGSLRTPRKSFGAGMKNQEWVHEVSAKGFEGGATPLAWTQQVNSLYDVPLEIYYDKLDPESTYTIRVAYTGRFRSKMKMTADGILIHDFIQTGIQPIYEFPIPSDVTKDGKVTFSWTCGEAERGSQVSEIWIIRNQN